MVEAAKRHEPDLPEQQASSTLAQRFNNNHLAILHYIITDPRFEEMTPEECDALIDSVVDIAHQFNDSGPIAD